MAERLHFHFSLSCIGEGTHSSGEPTPVFLPGESTPVGNPLQWGTHSSVLAWRIPGTAEPGGLPSMGLHRVEHY